MRLSGLVVALLALAPTALAQSKRYPAEPVDKDKEKAERSELWENAANPATKPYARLVAEAKAALAERTDAQRVAAIDKLGEAIALVPDDPQAFALRGEAYMELRDWAHCADDLEVAMNTTPTDDVDIKVQTEQRRKLGLCLARAGRLASAERVLAEAAASGTSTGEMLMRLGEVRIAMGKLDEAITALTAATDATDSSSYALTRWLLMAAYDRARRPADAIAIGRMARQYDRELLTLMNPNVPLIGTGEREYLLGLAWEYSRGEADPPEPERALLYFRRFLKLAPDSPWRKRAEEHLRDLKATVLPEAIARKLGDAAFDLGAARTVVRKRMPELRACLAKAPNVVFTVVVTKSGPKQAVVAPKPVKPLRPPTRYPYPTYRPYTPRPVLPPPDGVSIQPYIDSEPTSRADKDAAMRCIEPIVTKLPFAPIKEPNKYVQFSFALISSS
ncbi:MAG: tetratricopeptide repeat protein [Kofleriaceae bacterium]